MILIIDSNALCWRARHAMGEGALTNDGVAVEIIFNFLNQIYTLAKHHQTNKFVFCWDSRRNFRKAVYAPYKNSRNPVDKTEEQRAIDRIAFRQFSALRNWVLPELGFLNNYVQTGMEADDIIASTVQMAYACEKEDQLLVVSRDNDLWQLLQFVEGQYDFQTKKTKTEEKFRKEYGVSSNLWAEVKSIAGCPGDNVVGVPDVGPLTAIKYLENKLPFHYKAYKKIVQNKNIIERNRPLVTLPYEGTKDYFIQDHDLRVSDFLKVFEELGFKSFLKQEVFRGWEEVMGLI